MSNRLKSLCLSIDAFGEPISVNYNGDRRGYISIKGINVKGFEEMSRLRFMRWKWSHPGWHWDRIGMVAYQGVPTMSQPNRTRGTVWPGWTRIGRNCVWKRFDIPGWWIIENCAIYFADNEFSNTTCSPGSCETNGMSVPKCQMNTAISALNIQKVSC